MAERSRKRIAAGALLAASVLLMAAVHKRQLRFRAQRNLADDDVRVIKSRDEIRSDSNFYKYAYVIVTYHKSGHVLSRRLVTYLQNNLAFHFGPRLEIGYVSSRGQFDAKTKCTQLSLRPGSITIIDAPEFHCNTDELRLLFMHNPDPTRGPKFGVKVIHLVRNPFAMAVSNYHFHSQEQTPEPFVHTANPCESLNGKFGPANDVEANLVAPKLTNTKVEIAGEMKSIMTRDDLDNIVKDCYSLWRTKPGLADGTYFDHLRALDPKEGVRMATADKFVHFALLASDLIMFDRVKRKVGERNVDHPGKHNEFHLLTMAMDDWIDRPDQSMYEFIDFVFQNHMPEHRKTYLGNRHKKQYLAKAANSTHITNGKNAGIADLIEYLREDVVIGGPLARIEVLLDSILQSIPGRKDGMK